MTSFAWIYFALAFGAGAFLSNKITKWFYEATIRKIKEEGLKALYGKNKEIEYRNKTIDDLQRQIIKLSTNDSTKRTSGL